MDYYKFQDELSDWLHLHDKEFIRALCESSTRLMTYERDEKKLASALMDTAYMILHSAPDTHGGEVFIELLEKKLDTFNKAKNITVMKERTRAIETANQD